MQPLRWVSRHRKLVLLSCALAVAVVLLLPFLAILAFGLRLLGLALLPAAVLALALSPRCRAWLGLEEPEATRKRAP